MTDTTAAANFEAALAAAGIGSTLDGDTPLADRYYRLREGEETVHALAPSDANGVKPLYDRNADHSPAPGTGMLYCSRCARRGHTRRVHRRDTQTCHADGWKAATVAEVLEVAGPDAAEGAQRWLSRWSPAEVLEGGCVTCNMEDDDWGSRSIPRECGVDCC